MNYDNIKNSITDDYPYIGSWKVVRCDALDGNSEASKIEGTIVEFEAERIINIPDKKIFKNSKAAVRRNDSASSSDDSDSSENEYNVALATANAFKTPSINDVDEDDGDDEEDCNNNNNNNSNACALTDPCDLSFKNGDIIWHLVENNDYISLFECKTFQFDEDELKLYGSITGMPIKLTVSFTNALNTMHLTYDKVLNIECHRLSIHEDYDSKFSFINVYNDNFLSSVCIRANNGRLYYAHKSILYLTLKDETDEFLNKLQTTKYSNECDLIELVLSYCYTNCLSSANINENRSNVYFEFIRQFKNLNNLEVLLNNLFSNLTFKKQISSIIKEIKESIERVVASFKCRDEQVQFGGIFAEPARFCEIIKSAIKEIAFAFVKTVTLFDLFAFKQDKLSKNERHEIIREVKQSLPFFIKHIHKLLFYIYLQCKNLNETQRRELAEYLVSKIDNLLAEIVKVINNGRVIFDKLLNDKNSQKDKSKSSIKNKLEKSLKNALHVKELKQLKKYNDRFIKHFTSFQDKLKTYQDMNQDVKLNVIFKELNSCIESMKQNTPSLLRKIEKYSLNEFSIKSLNIKDFKYTFKCIASKTMWVLDKFRDNKEATETTIKDLCLKIDEKNFTAAVDYLNLTTMSINNELVAASATSEASNYNDERPRSVSSTYILDSLCQPQSANKNHLAENALELYLTGLFADIEFAIQNHDANANSISSDPIKVHGAIVGARCMWFKRALSSGMKESIDKKVVLHDTNKDLFEIFVRYLYSGSISSVDLSIDEFIELAALADRYECDSLKYLIQRKLIKKFHENTSNDENSIVDLLNVADQINMDILKKYCISYIEQHDTVQTSDEFKQLSEHLIKQIDLTKRKEKTEYEKFPDRRVQQADAAAAAYTDSDSDSDSGEESDTETNSKRALLLSYAHPLIVVEYERLETCYDQLKEIINDNHIEFDDQLLVKSIITNEYDLNRVLLNDVFNVD